MMTWSPHGNVCKAYHSSKTQNLFKFLTSSFTFYSDLHWCQVYTEYNSKHSRWIELTVFYIMLWFLSTYTQPDSQSVNCTTGTRKAQETCINFCQPLGYYSENYSFRGWNGSISCQLERNVFSPCCQQINLNACGKDHWAHSIRIILDQRCDFIRGYCKQEHKQDSC